MIGTGIDNGNHVIIEQSDIIDSQQIGDVYYNGGVTLKGVEQMGESVLLTSEYSKYEPIHIKGDDFKVMGKLIGAIRKL